MVRFRTITLRNSRIWIDEEGILRCEGLPGSAHTKADAEETVDACWELSGHRRRLALVDVRRTRSVDREARLHYGRTEAARRCLAAAMLVSSPLSWALGNFFVGLHKPPYPIRLFTSEPEALRWLQGLIVDAGEPAETEGQITLP